MVLRKAVWMTYANLPRQQGLTQPAHSLSRLSDFVLRQLNLAVEDSVIDSALVK